MKINAEKIKKRSKRRKHCACAGYSKVRTPPARQPARPFQTRKRTDRTDNNTLRRSYLARSVTKTLSVTKTSG